VLRLQPRVETACLHRLKPKHEKLLLSVAFNLNLRPYGKVSLMTFQGLSHLNIPAHTLKAGPARQRSPRHMMPFNSSNEGSNRKRVSVTWRAVGPAAIARHVIGCHCHSRNEGSKRVWMTLTPNHCQTLVPGGVVTAETRVESAWIQRWKTKA